jgi:hypothetical protein
MCELLLVQSSRLISPNEQQVMIDESRGHAYVSHSLVGVKTPAFFFQFFDCFADIIVMPDQYTSPFFQLFTSALSRILGYNWFERKIKLDLTPKEKELWVTSPHCRRSRVTLNLF